MVGKNNDFLKNSQSGQEYQRFSLRKLSIGVVSVAIAAGFYFADLTGVQADTVTPENTQAAVANQDNQTGANSQAVVLSATAQTAKSAVPESSASATSMVSGQATAPASTEMSVAPSSQEINPAQLKANATVNPATKQEANSAQDASLNMYAQGKKQASIVANGNQVVGIKGSFVVTEDQLAKANPVTIGTITQERSAKINQGIPVLVRTGLHAINITQGGKSVELGELHIDKDDLGEIILSLQNINRNVTFVGDKKINFDIPVALDLNHAADASSYAGTSYSQTVTFKYNSEKLFTLKVNKPSFNGEKPPRDFYIQSNVSGEVGIFSVHGNYISAKEVNNFLNNPLSSQPATLPDNYQWGVTLQGSQNITDIQVSGGAPLDVLFDLSKPNTPKSPNYVHNNGAVPLWENLASNRAADNLSLDELKAQQQAQRYEGLLWSRQDDGKVNLWFNWSRTRLHSDWVNAVNQKYGTDDSSVDSSQRYRDSLRNYFKNSLYTTLSGVSADKFAEDNMNAYYHFLGDNPLMWYQEIHVISYDSTLGNDITVKVNNAKQAEISTHPGTHQIQGRSSIKVHFIDADSKASDLSHAEVVLPEGPMSNDGETKTAWQGERNLVNFSVLSGYDIVSDDQQIAILKNQWNSPDIKVLKSASAIVTFPEKEGVTDDYYVFVTPRSQEIPLTFVDDDNKDQNGNPQPVKDVPATSIKGPTGSTVEVPLPESLKQKNYLLNKTIFTIAYKGDGKPAFEVDQNGNAVIHLHHEKWLKQEKYPVHRTIIKRLPNSDKVETIDQVAQPFRYDLIDKVTGQVEPGIWSTDTTGWASVATPDINGYKPVIIQQVGDTQTILNAITSQPVDQDTQSTTITVTYTATATAKLTGNAKATYTGKQITINDLNNGLKITVTGPTANAGSLALRNGDVEFSTDGKSWSTDLPTAANTYRVRLTAQGEAAIKAKYGNANIVWTRNGKSTITSDATFTINRLKSNSTLEGADTKVYDGAAAQIDPNKLGATVKLGNQTVKLDMTGLTSADFSWTDSQGNEIAAPKSVGTYYIKLTSAGLSTLQKHNGNFALTNSGLGTYIIAQAQAQATLSGSGTRAYNGSEVTVDDLNVENANNTITLTLHYPEDGNAAYSAKVKLTVDDFVWKTPDGKAPVEANNQVYTLSLNPAVIKQLLMQIAGSGQDSLTNVTVADDAITGKASYIITPLASTATLSNIEAGNYGKIYDGQPKIQIDPVKLHITTTVAGGTVELNTSNLTGDDFNWVDGNGTPLAGYPVKVGTYYIVLNSAGLKQLQDDNPNFRLVSAGRATYTINQAQGTAELVGNNAKDYDGSAISTAEINAGGQIVVSLAFPGAQTNASYTLQYGDYTITPKDAADTSLADAGTYTITLTAAGKNHIRAKLEELAGRGQDDQANATVADDAISGDATFTINAAKNIVSVSGTQTATYTGQPVNVAYNAAGNNSVIVKIAANAGAVADISSVQLDSDDFQIVDSDSKPITAAVDAGDIYHIVLTDDGVTKIQNKLGKNYQISQDTRSFGKLVINKAAASATFSGNPTYTYTGRTNSDYLKDFKVTLNEPGNPAYTLQNGDIEFNVGGNWTGTVPTKVGVYQVRLSASTWTNIKNINQYNVSWPENPSAGTGTYTITPATATAKLSGENSMVFYNHAVTTGDLYASGSTIHVAINGDHITGLPTDFRLEDGDYTWNTADGKAPEDHGSYTITLTATGLNKIQAAIDNAKGIGAGNVVLSHENTGSATFTINQAVSPNVQLVGEQGKSYNGQAASFDPTDAVAKNNYHFRNTTGLVIPNLTAADFEWVDGNGKAIAVPTNVGDYYLQLNVQGRAAFANANPNYVFVDKNGQSTIGGRIAYHITRAILKIGVSGTASKVYDRQNAVITQQQLDNSDVKLAWGNSQGELVDEPAGLGKFTLKPRDLEVVDGNGNAVSDVNVVDANTVSPTYYIRLTRDALSQIKALSGAENYSISWFDDQQPKYGTYLIYAHKALVTLTGGQSTSYGTYLPLEPKAYVINLTNWTNDSPEPTNAEILQKIDEIGGFRADDFYIEGYPTADRELPTEVGSYRVRISGQLLAKLKQAFPNYDWNSADDVAAEHSSARYVIMPAAPKIAITGAQHIKYGEAKTIKYGDGGYTLTLTAPVKRQGDPEQHDEAIYTTVKLADGDLEFVSTPGSIGPYQVKLSEQGLDKLAGLPGITNYDWRTRAVDARANFYVDQMPVTITVAGDPQNIVYGSSQWLAAIKKDAHGNIYPHGYTLTVKNADGMKYTPQAGDLVFDRTPGDVGSYAVYLSNQGLANIKEFLGTNYTYPQTADMVSSYGTFTVSQGKVTVTLNDSDGKTYDGQFTTPADLHADKYNLTYSTTVYAADGTPQTITLTNSDLRFVNGNPADKGHYQVALSQAGRDRLAALTGNNGANYQWTFNTNATYDINAATKAGAQLTGDNQKVFDGTAVTTAQVNNGGSILVQLKFPGSTADSTYLPQDGDYEWYSEDGQTKLTAAPSQQGNYTIKLTKSGLDHLQAAIDRLAGRGNVVLSADQLAGSATFAITAKPITGVTISGDAQYKVYDGQTADLDVSGLTISGDGALTNDPLSLSSHGHGITPSDFDWYDETGQKLKAAPVNVGYYDARLTSRALASLQAANPNYSFGAVSGTIEYRIDPAMATAKLGNKDKKTYNSQGMTLSAALKEATWTAEDLVNKKSFNLNLTGLTYHDYYWTTQNDDNIDNVMTGLPTDAGTYYLKLKKESLQKVQDANPNYYFNDDAIGGAFTYIITAAKGSATLGGQAAKTYDGQAVTTAVINGTGGNIEVTFTFLGNTDATYQLQDGDYDWYDASGQHKLASAPTVAGSYMIKIKPAKLQDIMDRIAGRGNVTVSGDSGSAAFTINKRNLTVTLDDKPGVNAGKTYDGQPATVDPSAGRFSTVGLVNRENLNTAKLTASDYEWQDEAGNVLQNTPTDAGTYYVALSANGLANLQAANPNYNVTESGRFKYVISPAAATVTVDGSQEGTSAVIDNSKFNTAAATGITIPAGLTYQFAGSVPVESGIYDVTLTPASVQRLQAANPNYSLTIESQTKFALDAILTVTYADTDNGNQQVGTVTTTNGAAGKNVDLALTLPENYELAAGQILPTTYTFSRQLHQRLIIRLVHRTVLVDPLRLDTNPVPTNVDWFKQSNLTKDVTRTIDYAGLRPDQLDQIPTEQKKQTVSFTRTARYDLVTGKLVNGSTGNWLAVNGQDTFAGFTPYEFAGYTAGMLVPEATVNGNDQDNQLTVVYTADAQTVTVVFVDDDQGGTLVGDPLTKTGVTDQTTTDFGDVKVPDHYALAAGQSLPTSYKFTADQDQTITIHLTEKKVTVDPTVPDTNPVPTNKNWFTDNDLERTVTRTIDDQRPSGTRSQVQTATIYRTATYNEATGELTGMSDWSTASWASYQVTAVPGYTAHITESVDNGEETAIEAIGEVTVTDQTKPTMVAITYTADSQVGKISYVDDQGHEIGYTALTGVTGEDIRITPQVPAGWVLAPGNHIPAKVQATENGIATVIVKIQHGIVTVKPSAPKTPHDLLPDNSNDHYPSGVDYGDLHKTVTRKVTINEPNREPQTVTQTAELVREAQVDEVTHEVSYGQWQLAGDGWAQMTAPTVPGYTASGNVEAVVPDGETKDTAAVIDYTPDVQTGKISYVDEHNHEVGQTSLAGVTDGTVKISPVAPTGWKISAANTIPAQVIAGANGIETVTVYVEHDYVTVDPSDPRTTADVIPNDGGKKFPSGVAHDDLNKTITRTITVKNPHGGDQVTVQRATSRRSAMVDMVDGTVTYGDWSIETLPEFETPAVAGYTPDRTVLSDQLVTGASEDSSITIRYTADAQHGFIQYVDGAGTVIGYTPFNSTTDVPVVIVPHAPIGWKISDPTSIPGTVTPQPGQETVVKVAVEHDHVTVTPTDPKTPADVIPNDGGRNYPSGVDHDSLNKTVTRIIHVADDTGTLTPYDVVNTVNLSRSAIVDMVTGEVAYGEWVPDGAFPTWQAPEITGYTPNTTAVSAMVPDGNTTDQAVNVVYHANDGQQTIEFVDGEQVIAAQVVKGKVDHDAAVQSEVPAGWKLAGNTTLPTLVKIPAADRPIRIPVEHDHITVMPTAPKTPSDVIPGDNGKHFPSGVDRGDLNKTVTRTITVISPDGRRETTKQTAELQRTATVDMVTGDVEYGDWIVVDNGWGTFKVLAINGYTPNEERVPAVTVDGTTNNANVEITYTANRQTGVLRYVDAAGNEIAHTSLHGHTGDHIAITPQAPAGWVIDGAVPSEVIAGPDGIPTVTVNVKHNVITVHPGDLPNRGDRKPGNPNKRPGDGTPNQGILYDDLHRDVTRTITIHNPLTGDQVDAETISYERSAMIDDVDGSVAFGDWLLAQSALQTKFNNVDFPLIPGYTMYATQGDHGEGTLTQEQINSWTDPQIEVNYVADGQKQVINYLDESGKVVSTDTILGQTGDDIAIVPVAPEHYSIKPGQNLPSAVTLGVNNPAINVVVTPKLDPLTDQDQLSKVVSRTIVVNVPGKPARVIRQTVTFQRTGVINEVTGEVVYGQWNVVGGRNTWAAYVPEDVPGYTADKTVTAQTVTGDTADTTVEIGYIANDQSVTIKFVDDDSGTQVGPKIVKTGKTDQVISDLDLTVPEHYLLAAGQKLPISYAFTADKDQTITIHLVEKRISVDPADPKTNPEPQDPSWFKDHHLVKEIARTITDELPGGMKLSTQTATLYRTATYNEATGQLTNLSDWSTDAWNSYQVNVPAGYTVEIKRLVGDKVEVISAITPEEVTANTPSQVIMIAYAPKSTPTEPTRPTDPTNPTSPVNPTVPTDPTNPITPATPTSPTSPTRPTEPTTPVSPTVPTDPTVPTEPTMPTSPAEPADPTAPTGPEASTDSKTTAGSTAQLNSSAVDQSSVAGQSVTPSQAGGKTSPEQASNDNLISAQMVQSANEKQKQRANQLPQTGNGEGKQASALGLAFAALASLIGMAGTKRKKREDK